MTAAVYSTRFLAGGFSDTFQPIYTVPVGFRAILRDLDAVGTGSELLELTNLDAGSTIFIGEFPASGTYGHLQWQGRQVAEAGERIQIIVAGSIAASVALSGYLLTLP